MSYAGRSGVIRVGMVARDLQIDRGRAGMIPTGTGVDKSRHNPKGKARAKSYQQSDGVIVALRAGPMRAG